MGLFALLTVEGGYSGGYSGGYAPVYTLRCLQWRAVIVEVIVEGMSLFILCVAYSGGYAPVYTLRCL